MPNSLGEISKTFEFRPTNEESVEFYKSLEPGQGKILFNYKEINTSNWLREYLIDLSKSVEWKGTDWA